VRDLLRELSTERARHGFTPSETATFVFSLKEPLFSRLRQEIGMDAATLAEQKKKLEAALAERTRTAQALAESGLGRSEGYSASLRALARLSMQGVWLTRVQFAEKEGEVALVGMATHPELVAAYLERLRKEEALRGQAFSRLEIRRPAVPQRAGVVEFTLSSAGPAPQGRK